MANFHTPCADSAQGVFFISPSAPQDGCKSTPEASVHNLQHSRSNHRQQPSASSQLRRPLPCLSRLLSEAPLQKSAPHGTTCITPSECEHPLISPEKDFSRKRRNPEQSHPEPGIPLSRGPQAHPKRALGGKGRRSRNGADLSSPHTRRDGRVTRDGEAAPPSRLGACTVTKRTPAIIKRTARSFPNVSTSSPHSTPAVAATAGCT